MKSYFAYIRVSTTRQGEEGVSLQEQKRSILDYARRHGITITEWFEEQVSAAKGGRPVFSRLIAMLKKRRSVGIIIHKIDRGARNLRDWADLSELMDRGVEIHFAHESIDLHSRSGRLSADILAIVASDFIRNLREEVLKGINGRLQQGLFPFAAPTGYLNQGSGKPKTIDPMRGPMVRLAFELYASRRYSLQSLADELFDRGLRNSAGTKIRHTKLALILRNPFYIGTIRLRGREETFPGVHDPLVESSVFNEVQAILDGRKPRFRHRHRFLFSRVVRCERCNYHLIGEKKKGHVYYRCHQRTCPATCIREERLAEALPDSFRVGTPLEKRRQLENKLFVLSTNGTQNIRLTAPYTRISTGGSSGEDMNWAIVGRPQNVADHASNCRRSFGSCLDIEETREA